MIGRTISHYRIVSQLGRGGMGVVYEAEDTRLGRRVALKLLPPELCCDPESTARFLREARLAAGLNHPHICTLHDIGEQDDQHFMVMELLEGESLKERIARGVLPVEEAVEIGVQIADALDAAHSAGIIHRDVKPANLFLTKRLAKVLDFGVAKLAETGNADRPDLANTVAASEKTTVGSAIGTVAYMSPEQARGQEIDGRSDLFSLGVVLYEMVTGTPAFSGATHAVIFEGILTKQPRPPSQINARVPPELDHIIAKALEKDRNLRYQSAAELRADLRRLQRATDSGLAAGSAGPAGASGSARTAGATGAAGTEGRAFSPGRNQNRKALLVGAPLAIGGMAIAAVFLWQSQQTPALAMRDTVVLADFQNSTGDAMFDDTLSQALGVQLRQSPYLSILPEQQVEATLQMMGRDVMTPLTLDIAREVCVRTAAKAVLGGSISAIGNQYLLTLSARNCVDGEIIAEQAVDAAGKDAVLASLGQAASAFREQLGESLASVQRYDQNIEQATTRSLDALKAYSQGMTTRRTQGDFESVPFFRRAIELDPEFALAHGRLGTVLSNLGQREEAEKAATRAYELRDKASERERLYIEARYHNAVGKDLDKAIESYRLLLATYPDDYAAHSNIGSLYRNRGEHDRALFHLEEAVRLASMQPLGHLNLAGLYLDLGRFDEARREYEEVLKLQENVSARTGLMTLGAMTGDQALIDEHAAAARGPRAALSVAATLSQAAAYRGRMKDSARHSEEFLRLARDERRVAESAQGILGFAINQAMAGRHEEARRMADRLLAEQAVPDNATDEMVALGAVLGDRAMADAYYERARIALREGAPAESAAAGADPGLDAIYAMARGDFTRAYERGIFKLQDSNYRYTSFVAGVAALQAKRWDDAVKVFDTILGFGPKLGLSPLHAVTQIMRARAHAGAGRVAEARSAYEAAFEVWKNADPDLPLLLEARQEYARLTS